MVLLFRAMLAAALWGAVATLLGLAVYIHYFLDGEKNVFALVLGGAVMLYFAVAASEDVSIAAREAHRPCKPCPCDDPEE